MLLPNYNITLSWTEVLSEVYSLPHLGLEIAEMNVYTASSKRASWGMSLPLQSSRLHCLRKDAIYCKEHTMLQTLL